MAPCRIMSVIYYCHSPNNFGGHEGKGNRFSLWDFEATELCCGWYYSSRLLVAVLLHFLKEESDAGSEVMGTSAHLLCLSVRILCGLAVGILLFCIKSLLYSLSVLCEVLFGCLTGRLCFFPTEPRTCASSGSAL